MWRNKKLIILEVLVVVMLVATLGAVAVARADDETTTLVENNTTGLMEKVAEIYQAKTGTAIDPQELQNAFVQARNQNRVEVRSQCLDKLVEQGKITQEQADEFKAWLDARPDALSEEFQQWLDSRPDIMGMFGQNNGGGGMMFGSGRHQGKAGMGGGFGLQSHDCWSE
ncbi:MAG: hypothetical protein A2Y89_00145 [Chloroflexi bacterium RBG_13_51_18]|nr:MAG: hypothetical protein A2Y89_00145 [Chloroflexi bacterium RBG_13_51_18]